MMPFDHGRVALRRKTAGAIAAKGYLHRWLPFASALGLWGWSGWSGGTSTDSSLTWPVRE